MKEIYLQLRQRARAIVKGLPLPEFYTKFSEEIMASEDLFATTPVLIKIKKQIIPMLENDFGHGVLHSVLVCRDAGAIVMIEMQNALTEINAPSCIKKEYTAKSESDLKENSDTRGYSEKNSAGTGACEVDIKQNMILVQIAGLLHDIKRKHRNHAQKGADFAEKFLRNGYDLSLEDIDLICNAIREHEAFKQNVDINNEHDSYCTCNGNYTGDGVDGSNKVKTPTRSNLQTALLISGALYDADKFRWGPDNFTHTVWDMVSFSNTPFEEFKKRYPGGMAKLAEIKTTFRTDTGKQYGPEFIDLGIITGEVLLKFIQNIST